MAITTSAKKALRQTKRRRVMNVARLRTMRETMKDVRVAAKSGSADTAKVAAAYKAIDKAVKRGIIKKNTAARRKSLVARTAGKKA